MNASTKAILVLIALLGLAVFLGWRQVQPPVEIEWLDPPAQLGPTSRLDVEATAPRGGLDLVGVRLVQGDLTWESTHSPAAPRPDTLVWTTRLNVAEEGFQEGEAELQLLAHDSFWRPFGSGDEVRRRLRVTLDFTPPALSVLASTRYVQAGGSGAVVVRSEEADGVEVSVGGVTMPAIAAEDGRGRWVALFAAPLEDTTVPVQVTARDAAGNERVRSVPVVLRPRDIPRSTVRLPRDFLVERLPELLPELAPIEEDSLGAAFVVLSRDRRAAAGRTKVALSRGTADRPQWRGAFAAPRGTSVSSNFAQQRDYLYDGRALDTQFHMGYDLASTRRAPVPAAADGRVVFADDLGIYGNAVVIDHGLGLQTLYAHLTSFGVETGDEVSAGQELGRSGTTGLAVGDHIHFEVLVHGQPVDAREWWDAAWVRSHIREVLEDGGLGAWLD